MFKWYGILGIVLMIFVELNFFLKIQPFATYYFILVWLGYILFLDALVYKLSQTSYMYDQRKKLLWLFVLSAAVWWLYEFINIYVGNWTYNSATGWAALGGVLRKSLYFSTVIPAIFETAELLKALHIFDKFKLKHKHKVSKAGIYLMISIGILSLVLPMLWPKYFFPLVWLCFFLILDPINYLHGEPNLIKHLYDRNLSIPLLVTVSGLICGFFWEFWNFFALSKWYYHIPYVGFLKIFEMPLLGYLGYIPFAWSLYAIYHFINSMHKKHEKDII